MDVRIRPSTVSGRVSAPPSKSYTHRAVVAAGLSPGGSIASPLRSADIRASMDAMRAFGASIDDATEQLVVTGVDGTPAVPDDVIDCGNSGTTMRLITGVAGLVDGITVLTGDASLRDRPHGPLLAALSDLGAPARSSRGNGQAPLVIEGPTAGGTVSMPGDVSSQFITALLMAGACTEHGVEITLTTTLKSAPYVAITQEVLDAFGVETIETENGYAVPGGQTYDRGDPYTVPGDFSSISYLLGAGAVAAADPLTIEGAQPSAQGDTAIVEIVERMGGDVEWDQVSGELTVRESALHGVEVDVGNTPDLLPTVAALGAIADGTTRLVNCEHVRYKETDRVSAMATELEKFGTVVTEAHDVLTVHGGESTLSGTTVETYHDHRIAMALALVGLVASGETTISGAEHVDVSFPGFFDVLDGLGVTIGQ